MNWSDIAERNAQLYPEKEAVIFKGQRITYLNLYKRINSLAKGLLNLGVKKGDIVAILSKNRSEYIELTFAINKIGAAWLPLNFRLAIDELVYILNDAKAKVLISEKDYYNILDNVKDKILSVNKYIWMSEDKESKDENNYERIIKSNLGAEVPTEEVGLNDLSRLIYTSGTTSYPKGAMISYGNLHWKNLSHIVDLGFNSADKTLIVAPLFHVGGMDLSATNILHVGGSIVILEKFDPIEILKTIESEKITQMWLAPSMINMLFQEPTFNKYNLTSLRFVIAGGEKMPLPLIKEFVQRLPHTWLSDAYGMTETVSGDTFLKKDEMMSKLGSVGRPVLHLRLRIVDETDNDVPPKSIGEIVLKGPKVFLGYWNNEKATVESFKSGWFHTGDIGYLDNDGYLYIVDRKKDMIISGGENIASAEVERVIDELREVKEVAVIGIPHPKWLEVPKAFVVLKPGTELSGQKIIDYCANHLAKFKVPKEIEFMNELPRNVSGKVMKKELRKLSSGN